VSRRAMDGRPHGYKLPLARSAPVLCSARLGLLPFTRGESEDLYQTERLLPRRPVE